LDSVLETEIIYRIPRMEGTGHQMVINDMNEFQAKFPGGQFALHSVSEHHDVALMEWQLILPDGTPGRLGHDAIRVTPDGKLRLGAPIPNCRGDAGVAYAIDRFESARPSGLTSPDERQEPPRSIARHP
jgi:hypothetical protein